ncbi:MAG: HepT-like ribonuclease domain-containing protein [Candidatus Poribacteria bacterium]
MNESDIIRLRHMLDCAKSALNLVKSRTFDDLVNDRMFRMALIKEIEILGEAATKISDETRKQLPNIPWEPIIGMRNRLVHVYYDINFRVLWITSNYNIPRLIKELEKISGLIQNEDVNT